MIKIVQLDGGVVTGQLEAPQVPTTTRQGRTFVVVDAFPPMLSTYDAQSGTFTPPTPRVNTILSHADVIGLLTPHEWSEMNRYSPTAGSPYANEDVFYIVSVFNKAQYIDLSDARFVQMMATLVAEGIVLPARAAELQAQLVALAASRS